MGQFKLLSETYKMQIYAILKKSVEINETIEKFGATCNEAKMFYNLVWHPVIEYTLPQLFLSDIQLQKIDTKFTTLFCMCRYNRNTTYAICHGQIELGGADFVPISASVGSGYIIHY